MLVKSLAPGKFEWNFRYVIFERNLVTDGWGISCEIVQIWYSLVFTDEQSTFVQVMAWCHQATSYYLGQCSPRSMLPYGVTRPQWVKMIIPFHNNLPIQKKTQPNDQFTKFMKSEIGFLTVIKTEHKPGSGDFYQNNLPLTFPLLMESRVQPSVPIQLIRYTVLQQNTIWIDHISCHYIWTTWFPSWPIVSWLLHYFS